MTVLRATDRSHLLAITVRAMRQVLVDHARRWGAHKLPGSAFRDLALLRQDARGRALLAGR